MKKQAKANGPKSGGSYLDRAQARWGASMPEWVAALAAKLDAEIARGGSQATLGKKIGLTSGQISGVIGKTYPVGPKLKLIEETVRGALLKDQVQCPALGMVIGRNQCAAYQTQKNSTASPMAMRLAATCPHCPNAVRGKP